MLKDSHSARRIGATLVVSDVARLVLGILVRSHHAIKPLLVVLRPLLQRQLGHLDVPILTLYTHSSRPDYLIATSLD